MDKETVKRLLKDKDCDHCHHMDVIYGEEGEPVICGMTGKKLPKIRYCKRFNKLTGGTIGISSRGCGNIAITTISSGQSNIAIGYSK